MIYVGVHQTTDLGDGYMGSGQLLKRAQKKYGIENFEKEVIKVCSSRQEMFEMESMLVNKDFVNSKQTYNVFHGGRTGPADPKGTDYYTSGNHVNNIRTAQKKAVKFHLERKKKRVEEYYQNPIRCATCGDSLAYEKKRNKFCSKSCAATFNNTGRVISEKHKRAVSKTLKARFAQPN